MRAYGELTKLVFKAFYNKPQAKYVEVVKALGIAPDTVRVIVWRHRGVLFPIALKSFWTRELIEETVQNAAKGNPKFAKYLKWLDV